MLIKCSFIEGKKTGEVAILKDGDRFIYNLVTKSTFWEKPTYQDLQLSLRAMQEHCRMNKVQELSMPKIGCGLDQLNWDRVTDMIKNVFKDTDISITIYDYDMRVESPQDQFKWSTANRRTPRGRSYRMTGSRSPTYRTDEPFANIKRGRRNIPYRRPVEETKAADGKSRNNPDDRSASVSENEKRDMPKMQSGAQQAKIAESPSMTCGTSEHSEPSLQQSDWNKLQQLSVNDSESFNIPNLKCGSNPEKSWDEAQKQEKEKNMISELHSDEGRMIVAVKSKLKKEKDGVHHETSVIRDLDTNAE